MRSLGGETDELRIFLLHHGTVAVMLQRVDHLTMSPRRTVGIGWNKPTGSKHFNGRGSRGSRGVKGSKVDSSCTRTEGSRDHVPV
jgi:hypothetical protein